MAVLNGKRRSAPALLALVSALGCVLASCILSRGGDAHAKLAFSHKMHVVEQKLECINCHADVSRSEQPGMPAPDACSVCHDEIDATKPPEQHVAALFDGETFRALHAEHLANELVFSHRTHASTFKNCSVCHTGIESNERIEPSAHFKMDDCTSCHAGRNVAAGCEVCHKEVRAEVAPQSHFHNWKQMHGQCARTPGAATSDRCALCHQESTCIQCHREEAPANHNVYWKERGHGITAMIDRANCSACHQPDSCIRCHSDTLPQSHTPMWGAPRDVHCFGCHFPLRSEGCVTCHPNTASHNLAPPKPHDPFHVRGENCRQCHGLSTPLVHVDNGDDCNACHH